MLEIVSLIALIVKANCPAPKSSKSSLVTDVITTCLSSISFAVRAIFMGSIGSTASGDASLSTLQKPHDLVHISPSIMNVAVGFEKHSPIFGHLADSQTVCRFLCLRTFLTSCSLLGCPRDFFNHGA